MNLLRFDSAGASDDSFGITDRQIAETCEMLRPIRETIKSESTAERLLIEYDRIREASELGRVFRVANRLHDHLDAVAVIGRPPLLLAASAWMQACCQPYHNELSRSGRGSKPRMYFAENGVDNDSVEGLLRRLHLGGYGSQRHGGIGHGEGSTDRMASGEPTEPIDRYAVIAVDSGDSPAGASSSTAIVLRLLIQQLAGLLGPAANRWLPKLVVPVTSETGRVRQLAGEWGCDEIFQFNETAGGPFAIYSAASLLPAAFLGLDCIQFLVGATAMNEHFRSTPPSDNIVMRYVAVMQTLKQFRQQTERWIEVWNPALQQSAKWYQQLSERRQPRATRTAAVLAGTEQFNDGLPPNVIINHLLVEKPRTTPIPLPEREYQHPGNLNGVSPSRKKRGEEPSVAVLPDRTRGSIAARDASLRALGHPSTKLILPGIEMHTLGQLFQFWLLVDQLERAADAEPESR